MNRIMLLILAVCALVFDGCGGDAQAELTSICRRAGVCAEPPLPAIVADLLVDVSFGAPTSPSTASEDAATLLVFAAERPNSMLRIWILGEHLEDTNILHTVTVPRFRGRAASQRAAEATRFIAAERARVASLIAPYFARPRPRNSPIYEGIARVALADSYGRKRFIAVTTDGREVSSALSADYECARFLPTVAQQLAQLHARRILEVGALANVDLYIARMSSPPIPGRGCAVGMARELHIREILKSVLRTAGAARVEIESGGLFLRTNTREEGP